MIFLKLPTFCRCIDLRTGGLIVGYILLIVVVIDFFLGNHWINCLVNFVTTILLLHGIHRDYPRCIIPSLVVNIVELIVLILYGIVIIPICSFAYLDETKEYLTRLVNPWILLDTDNTTILISVLWVEVAIWIAIQWYFTAVIATLYEYMKNPNQENSNTGPDATELV